jgi:hypothetical protein
MVIEFGEPVAIPQDIPDDQIEPLCQQLEEELNQMTDRLDHMCGYKSKP